MTRAWLGLAAVALVLGACKGDNGTDETDSGGDTQHSDGITPWVVEGEIDCETVPVSEPPVVQFLVSALADDDQGTFTLVRFPADSVAVYAKGTQTLAFQASYIVCENDGVCSGSWNETFQPSVPCARIDEFDYFVTVTDDDGHRSEPFKLAFPE